MNLRSHAILGLCALVTACDERAPASRAATELSCDAPGVREVVARFGERLQRVSLQAPDSILVRELREAYTPLVTRELLDAWMSEPRRAPGREVSSPWPARIDVRSVEAAEAGVCRVEGDVVYASSAPAPNDSARGTPVTLMVRQDDGWRIAGYEARPVAADSGTATEATQVLRRDLRLLLEAMLGLVTPAVQAQEVATVPGVEQFLADVPTAVRGKRVGLITNHTGVDSRGVSIIDHIAASPDVRLVALFAPEHGIRGTAADGVKISSSRDAKTGLPIFSLYGETRRPTPRMLAGIDALLFDMQDVGARPYTYISTMALAMQAAKTKGIPFVVLDRPNPIGGHIVEGNVLDSAFKSFTGIYPIASRHGMTIGELARMFNERFGIGANLIVIPMRGWKREMWFDETGLPWINPSPNIRRLETAIHYPGTVFIEATNLSEGRGSDQPLEQAGAPWLRAREIADSMNAMRLPGVRFEAVHFTPAASAVKYGGRALPGVRFILTDRESYRPVRTALLFLDLVRRLHPNEFRWTERGTGLDRLAGTGELRKVIERDGLPELLAAWGRDAEMFVALRRGYLLY